MTDAATTPSTAADLDVPTGADGPAPKTWTTVVGLLIGVVGVASSALLIRAADEAPVLSIALWRNIGGAAVLLPLAWPAIRRGALVGRWRRLALSGVLLAIHFVLWIGSLSFTTIGSATTLVTSSAIFVAVGAGRFLNEPASGRTWIGIWITISGAVLIGVGDAGGVELGARALLGDVMALGGALAAAGYMLVGRNLRRDGMEATAYAGVVYAITAVVLVPAVVLTGAEMSGFEAETWWALIALVVGAQLLGHTVFNALLGRVTATTVSIVILSEPVLATIGAWLLLSEVPSLGFWLGAPVIGVGVLLGVTRTTLRRGRPDRAAQSSRSTAP